MKSRRAAFFVIAGLWACGAAFAGPIDNAMEFQEKAVEEAEKRNVSPQASGKNAPISWDGDDSGAGGAVNTGEATEGTEGSPSGTPGAEQ